MDLLLGILWAGDIDQLLHGAPAAMAVSLEVSIH